jgi:hypothetical protein
LNRIIFISLLALIQLASTYGQFGEREKVIQVTGIISDYERHPVQGASVISQKLGRGSISEESGIYNVIALPGDTIWLSALGYRSTQVYVPYILDTKQITKDILLLNDTINIKDVIILPWKTYAQFKRDFLTERKPIPEIVNMYQNLATIEQTLAITHNYSVTPEAGFRMAMQQNANALYYRGQSPVNNLLNPFAWAKFVNGLKSGLMKNEQSSSSTTKPAKTTKSKVKKKKSG